MAIDFIKTLDNYYYNVGRKGCSEITEEEDHYIVHESGNSYVKVMKVDIARVKYTGEQPPDNSNAKHPSDSNRR